MEHIFFMGVVFFILAIVAAKAGFFLVNIVFLGVSAFMFISLFIVGRHDYF